MKLINYIVYDMLYAALNEPYMGYIGKSNPKGNGFQ